MPKSPPVWRRSADGVAVPQNSSVSGAVDTAVDNVNLSNLLN